MSVLTQKQDWGGLSRSWQLPGFARCANLLLLSADITLWDVSVLPPGDDFAPSFIYAALFLVAETIESSPQVWNGFILSFHSFLSFSLLFMPTNKRQTRGQKNYWQPRTKREISVLLLSHSLCVSLDSTLYWNWTWSCLGLSASFCQTSESEPTWMTFPQYTCFSYQEVVWISIVIQRWHWIRLVFALFYICSFILGIFFMILFCSTCWGFSV